MGPLLLRLIHRPAAHIHLRVGRRYTARLVTWYGNFLSAVFEMTDETGTLVRLTGAWFENDTDYNKHDKRGHHD